MLVRVRLGQGASWSGCELVRVRGCELTNRVRVDSGASWYWGELTRKPLFYCVDIMAFFILEYLLIGPNYFTYLHYYKNMVTN